MRSVRFFLSSWRWGGGAYTRAAIITASRFGHADIVQALLTCFVDPSVENNMPLCAASENGHGDIVRILLADKRVDPRSRCDAALLRACDKGHASVVRALLDDGRVDPSWGGTNKPLICACEGGHVGVVQQLLRDKRVNPAHNGNYPIRAANTFWQRGVPVVRLLLTDDRVDRNAVPRRLWWMRVLGTAWYASVGEKCYA